jgi:poly(3-hydroxybutyrate) depolymerase
MRSVSSVLFLMVMVLVAAAQAPPMPPTPGYHTRLNVSAPTRLDWTFVLSNRSFARTPEKWLPADYESAKQTYDLWVPQRKDPKQPLPMIVFLAPGKESNAFSKCFKGPCEELGALFVLVREAGNETPSRQRIRIIMDIIDDVRRQFPTDPDRTYLTGFSGGGRISAVIGFALPEYFGGIMPLCASGDVREESWLRQRVADRLSVALITGEKDFNRGEVERLRGPYLTAVGVRTRVWVQPGLDHALPSEQTVREALRWLEDGLPHRRDLAKVWKASRGGDESRKEQAEALLAEGKARLGKPETLYSGLMQLQGIMHRWPDLGAATEARKILEKYDAQAVKPWEADDIAEQRRFLVARARTLDAYASGDLPPVYAPKRNDMLKEALDLWQKVRADSPDSEAGKEAARRLPILEMMIK